MWDTWLLDLCGPSSPLQCRSLSRSPELKNLGVSVIGRECVPSRNGTPITGPSQSSPLLRKDHNSTSLILRKRGVFVVITRLKRSDRVKVE